HVHALMRDQCSCWRNAGIAYPDLEVDDKHQHQRHRRDREPYTQAEHEGEDCDLDPPVVRRQAEGIEEIAAPADREKRGKDSAGDQGMAAQAQHRSAARGSASELPIPYTTP